ARAAAPARAAAGGGGVAATALRVAVEAIDDRLRRAGEMATSIVQIQGRHERTLARVNALAEQHALVQQRLGALQDLVHVRGVPAHRRALLEAVGSDDADFDPLELDEYSELHSATNAFAEALTDARELTDELRGELVNLEGMMERHEQVSAQLNEAVLAARLVPVDTIVSRLQRGVRQTCRVTGKRARLSVTGAGMLVDSEILNNIVDPLMHIVRNAVDHGIEPPGERVAMGKDESGQIALSFAREGENVVVRCRDDGAGFDFVRIRELAVGQGVVPGDRHLSEPELARLTLIPGFTTRRGTTQVSGRGIGLDVVHRSILDLRGSMDVESTPGRGSEITLRVPLTLISMHVLLVRVGERIYGVPSSTLEQALFSDAGPVVHTESEWIFRFADTDYALRTLADLVGLTGAPVSTLAERVAPLLLGRSDGGPVGVMVDELVDGRYLVVKRLGVHVPRVRGVIGASILADGSVAPVLDLRELMRLPAIPEVAIDIEILAQPVVAATNAPNVLVVDDSLSARRTLAQVISDAGYEARTAVDGLDAIEAIEERVPDLILLDLEMPRMNGLELASHLRADEATRDIPLVMITSRSTAKHREQAHAAGIDAFITKPYQEDEVAEQIRLLIPHR
ncbi:MAG: response regulator, partial [Gammaproteobacteria bacterium]|nr:response regulator [Gammaproteobacteria bacterium]